jgi:hypothetical protein
MDPVDARDARSIRPDSSSRLSEVDREWWEERAAIREFCGGMNREEAEREAYLDVRKAQA